MRTRTARLRMSIDRPACHRVAALVLAVALAGCAREPDAAGAAAPEPYAITHVAPATELFVEFPPLIAGEQSTFATHLTRLDTYQPVTEGTVDVVLSGGGAPTERFRIRAPRRPGLFAPTVVPRATGTRRLSVVLAAPGLSATHDLGHIRVFADERAAATAKREAAPEGEIGFPKEQQWRTDFAVAPVHAGTVRESVRAPATLRPSADGSFVVTAPTSGQVRASGAFPTLGREVARGQTLAMLVPRLGEGVDVASLRAGIAEAQAEASLASAEAARMRRLFDQQAVARRRVDEAQAAQRIAQARLSAAQQRLSPLGGGAGGIPLRAPMRGRLAQVHVANGAAVEQGDPLFHIIDERELWLEAHVSEADAARLDRPDGASFELPGLAAPVEIIHGRNGRLVGAGRVIDPARRTVPVVFALTDPPSNIVLNQTVQARVYTGRRRPALTVPATALIDDGGQRIAYVMRGGESFSRVPVKVGVRDGDRIEVLEGLGPGDRVVTRGAMQIRLAAATPEAMGHGHAH